MNPETLLERYKEARMNVMQANHDLLVLTKDAELTKLYVEKSVIEEAGGEKGLGPNESAQKRALSVALNDDKAYKLATGRIIQAQYQRDLAEAELDTIKFEMRLYEASLKDEENKAIVHFGTH